MKKEKPIPNIKTVVKLDAHRRKVQEYTSMKEAAKENDINYTSLSMIISRGQIKDGYYYEFAEGEKKEEEKRDETNIHTLATCEQTTQEAKEAFARKPYFGKYS